MPHFTKHSAAYRCNSASSRTARSRSQRARSPPKSASSCSPLSAACSCDASSSAAKRDACTRGCLWQKQAHTCNTCYVEGGAWTFAACCGVRICAVCCSCAAGSSTGRCSSCRKSACSVPGAVGFLQVCRQAGRCTCCSMQACVYMYSGCVTCCVCTAQIAGRCGDPGKQAAVLQSSAHVTCKKRIAMVHNTSRVLGKVQCQHAQARVWHATRKLRRMQLCGQ